MFINGISLRRACLMALALAAVLRAVLGGASPASAGSTPWLDRDNPSGKGDYEGTKSLLSLECRLKGTSRMITTGNPQGYHCELPRGGWCVNDEVPGGSCRDMEVRYSWVQATSGTTPWLDRDNPSGKGDYEGTKHHLSLSCRLKGNQQAVTTGNPQGYHCELPRGGWCVNNQVPGSSCKDMEVRFSW
jgi:hypothetical protein